MELQEYIFERDGVEYTIQIGLGVTKLIANNDPITGLPQEYRLKYFMCEEETKKITVMFASTLVTPKGAKIEEKYIDWVLNEDDFTFFELGVGIPAIKPSLINGLLSYGLKQEKYFQIGEPEAAPVEPTEVQPEPAEPAAEPAAEPTEPAAEPTEPAAEPTEPAA
jgi:hypothetical protein